MFHQLSEGETVLRLKARQHRGRGVENSPAPDAVFGLHIEAGLAHRPLAFHHRQAAAERQRRQPGRRGFGHRALDHDQVVARAGRRFQVALVVVLGQRGDAAAVPALLAAATGPEPRVRVAALHALGFLGAPAAVPVLAEAAAKSQGTGQEVAREALARISGPGVREAFTEQLGKVGPAVQAELVRAIGLRRDTAAIPVLLKMVQGQDAAVRAAAVRSLGQIADEGVAADLVGLVVRAAADTDREAAEKALSTIGSRSRRPEACAAPILDALRSAAPPARASLLRALGRLNTPEALQALRAGVEDKEPAVRDAAIRTLAECGGPDAAPELLRLAKEAAEPAHRVLAARGTWRLVALAADKPLDERWKMCEAAFAVSQRPEEKKLGLTVYNMPHCGLEVFLGKGFCVVGGEVSTRCYVDVEKIVRETVLGIGYNDFCLGLDGGSMGVLNAIIPQSPDINIGTRADLAEVFRLHALGRTTVVAQTRALSTAAESMTSAGPGSKPKRG